MGQRPGEPEQTRLGGAVGRYGSVADNGLYGADPDDGGVVSRTQVGKQRLDDEGMGAQIDVDDRIPQGCGQRAHRIHAHPAGGVDEAVDPLHRLRRPLHRGRHGGIVGDVDDERRHAERLSHIQHGRRTVPQRDGATFPDQHLGTGAPDTRRGAGDDHPAHGRIITLMQSALRSATAA
jgi:hypothetical protein